ncbi:MAG: hypothetical protein RIK87_18705 [Fuerstiella sp.]
MRFFIAQMPPAGNLPNPAVVSVYYRHTTFREYNTEITAMPSRKIPVYRHQKARNLAVVRIDGKDVYLGEYKSPESKTKYERLIVEWLRRHHQTPEIGTDITVCELMRPTSRLPAVTTSSTGTPLANLAAFLRHFVKSGSCTKQHLLAILAHGH